MSNILYPRLPILIVDDEEEFLQSAELALNANGITNLVTVNDSRLVMDLLQQGDYGLIILDINMPHIKGTELLPLIVEKYPDIPIIIISAINDVDNAVNCIKSGAFNYILKPVDSTRLATTVKGGISLREVKNENKILKKYLLKDELENPEAFKDIVTKSPSLRAIFKYIEAISKTPLPVLVTGETGAGKELIAKAIHKLSGRSGELVAINVAGLDDNLFSDTLFGHKKGAFTSGELERRGLIERAEGGTLFLDEIGDLSMESQVKLLRLLQEGSYYPLGSDIAKQSDARVVCATLQDIDSLLRNNKFRKDLYYRLYTHQIQIPPLRERIDDLPLLINHFVEIASEKLGKPKPTLPREIYTLLSNYDFPGNIRELEGIIFDAVSTHKAGVLSLEPIKEKIFKKNLNSNDFTIIEDKVNTEQSLIAFSQYSLPTLDEAENALIEEALKRTNGNQTIAAELLGISRRALNNRLQRKK